MIVTLGKLIKDFSELCYFIRLLFCYLVGTNCMMFYRTVDIILKRFIVGKGFFRIQNSDYKSALKQYTLKVLNFAGIKFRDFREF